MLQGIDENRASMQLAQYLWVVFWDIEDLSNDFLAKVLVDQSSTRQFCVEACKINKWLRL